MLEYATLILELIFIFLVVTNDKVSVYAVPCWVRHPRQLLPQRDQQQEHQPQEPNIANHSQYENRMTRYEDLKNEYIVKKG